MKLISNEKELFQVGSVQDIYFKGSLEIGHQVENLVWEKIGLKLMNILDYISFDFKDGIENH